MKKLFGTDGIRGKANCYPITPELALLVGKATATVLGAGAGTGELCGAITGAAMTLGRLPPVDPAAPVGSKKRTVALSTCWATSMTRRPPSVSTVSASRMPGSSPAGNVTSTTGPET